jgi:hypothetical protein
MPDYKNGKIYKLWSPEGDEIYIGSTIQPLYKRFHHHKIARACSSKILFEKYDDVRIELIECVPCDNKEQLNKKEGEYIRKLDCINRNIAGRTDAEYKKEYYEEKYKFMKQKYYQENKEKIKENASKKITCECGRTVTFQHKSRHERTKVHQAFICASAGNGEASISVPTNPCT